MKNRTPAALVLIVSLLNGCEKAQPKISESAPPPEAPQLNERMAPKPATVPADKPAPTSPETPGTGVTASRETPLPEPPKKPGVNSVLYAATRISVTSDEGVFGVPPGTQLRVVQVTETGFRVSDGKREFDVTEGQVSTGVAAAAGASKAEEAQRSADAAWHKAQLDAVQQQREAATRNAAAAAAEKKTRDLQARLDALIREEGQLNASIEMGRRQDSEAREARFYGRVFTRTITAAHQAAWAGRLAVVQAERQRVQNELLRQ